MKKTKNELKQEIKELKAQLARTYHFVSTSLSKTGTDKMMGSGVMLELTALGGRQLIIPVMIRDGLSKETIDAIQKDIIRSYKLTVELKP